MSKKFNLRWLSLSKPPVEGLNDRYSHYLLDSPFYLSELIALGNAKW